MAKFNLLEEPWIPVLREGRVEEVGLEEALLKAPEIVRIETPSPLEEAALYRLLLAVLHRALGGPSRVEEVGAWWQEGHFPLQPLLEYLNRYRERFYLFHEEAPFFQVADLPEENPLPWSKLLPELASGNNPTLFDHTTEASLPKVGYAQVARALLVHQTFTPGGLLRRYGVPSAKGAPLAGAAAFLPTGASLFETLLFNLQIPYQKDGDAPLWELPPLRLKDLEGHKTKWPLSGVTRVYTWPSRGVRLLDEGDGVRLMAYGPGVEPLDVAFRDPMVAYRKDAKGNLLPLRLSTEKAFWRDFGAMLPQAGGVPPSTVNAADELLGYLEGEGLDPLPTRGLRVLGQVSDQAKILDIRREVYPLPPKVLSVKAELNLGWALEKAEGLGQGLRRLALLLAREVLGSGEPGELSAFAASLPLERLYWHALDGSFPALLERLGKEGDRAWWEEVLRRAALEGWNATRIALGTEARHLKALAKGEALLLALLAEKEEVKR